MKPVEKLNAFLEKEGLALSAQPVILPTLDNESFIVQVRVLVAVKPEPKDEKNTPQDKS